MKNLKIILGGLLIICGLIALSGFIQAQVATTPVQDGTTAVTLTNEDFSALSDFEVELRALELTPTIPAAALPVESHGFYSAQHPYWPPMPGDILGLPIWPLGDGLYVLNDTNVNYVELQAVAEAARPKLSRSSPSGGGMEMMDSLISGSGGTPVYLTNLVATLTNGSMTVTFSIAGGTNGFAYDIYNTTNLANSPVYSQWSWLGQGYTTNSYTFANQPVDQAFYILAIPQQTMVVAWGYDSDGQCDVPSGLTNAIDVAGGFNFSLALRSDGTVVAWGDNSSNECNVPVGLTNVTSIAAGGDFALALLQNGTVVAWGGNDQGQTNVPAGLTNVTAIAAGDECSLALQNDGTVVAWGYNYYGQTNVPTLGPATQIAAGVVQGVALLTNSTVAMWAKYNFSSFGWNVTNVPAGLSNVVSIAAGACHTLALKADGTVTAWGAGGTNAGLNDDGQSIVPVGLSNVVVVAGGYLYSVALQSAGTVVAWGDDAYGETDVPDRLTGVKAISAGGFHGLAVRSGLLTPVIVEEPGDQYAPAGTTVTFSSEGEGVANVQYQWYFNGVNIEGATNATLTLINVSAADEGSYQVIISNSAGSVTSDAATFTLVTPPVITALTQPTNQLAFYQANPVLYVTVSAPGQSNGFPLSYQWQFDGTNIAYYANTASYTFIADTNSAGTYSVNVSNAAGSTNAVWQMAINVYGTLEYHLATNAVGYANGYSGSSTDETELSGWTYATYSAANMALLTNAVWSTNFWLHGVQGLSATPIGISNGVGTQTLLTMVSPRHYLRATHVGFPPGMIAFLDTNNIIYWRIALQQVDIGNDTSVGILNTDLPPSVGYLPIVPPNLSSYLPTNALSYVQGIGMNQFARVFSQPMSFGIPSPGLVQWYFNVPPFGLGTNWLGTIQGGDSSSPERFIIGNQLVLVSHITSGFGPNYSLQFDAINQAMHYLSTNNSVGTDYQLTPFSLTNWPAIQ